jgi:GT2 family glycosyltransferase
MVAAAFPQAHLLALPRNIGFTAANNLALAGLGFAATYPPDLRVDKAAAPPDYVLLLNPDAELTLGSLRQFVQAMERLPAAGVIGPYLQYGDGSFQHGAFAWPSLAQVALDLFPLSGVRGVHRLHQSRLNGRYGRDQWEGTQPFAVDFVLGAAMFVRGAAIAAVGGLDPQFWMYCEEMDWCLRMHEAGWGVFAAPGVRVIHHEAQSSRQVRWRAFKRLWQSRMNFYAKHRRRFGSGYLPAVRLLLRLGVANRRGQIEAQFARGEITGATAQEALDALAAVLER